MAKPSNIKNSTTNNQQKTQVDGDSTINRRRILTMGTALAVASVSTISVSIKRTLADERRTSHAHQPERETLLLDLGQQWREAKKLEKLLSEEDDRAYALAVANRPEILPSLAVRNVHTGEIRLMHTQDIEQRSCFHSEGWADIKRAELDQYYKARREVDDAFGYTASNQALEDQIDRRFDIEELIMEATAFSVAGMSIKMEVGRHYVDEHDARCTWAKAFRSVQDDLARLIATKAKEAA